MTIYSRMLCVFISASIICYAAPVQAQSFGDMIKRSIQERMRQRPTRNRGVQGSGTFNQVMRRDDDEIVMNPEEQRLATSPVTFAYSEHEIDRLRSQLSARHRWSLDKQAQCRKKTADWDRNNNCKLDEDRLVAGFYQELPLLLGSAVLALPYDYDSLKILKKIDTDFWAWSNHWESRDGYLRNMVGLAAKVTELRRSQIERSLRPRIMADVMGGRPELVNELFGDDPTRQKFYSAQRALGSGLIGHSQKMTVAARAMAEKKTVGHRS